MRVHVVLPGVLCLWLVHTAAAAGRVVQLITENPSPFAAADPNDPQYVITLLDEDNQPSELPQAGMLRHMLMTDAAGQRYNCSIPGTPSQFASAVAAQQQASVQAAAALPSRTPFELLDALTGLCLYRQDGLWTYELCHKKHVRQFRQAALPTDGRVAMFKVSDSTKLSDLMAAVETGDMDKAFRELGHLLVGGDADDSSKEDFSCGQYSGDDVQTEAILEDASSSGHHIKYVSHVYSGGADCLLTGAPRTAEVRYTCARDTKDNVVLSVREFPTCNYVVVVSTPFLCKHPAFVPSVQDVRLVSCLPVDEEGQAAIKELRALAGGLKAIADGSSSQDADGVQTPLIAASPPAAGPAAGAAGAAGAAAGKPSEAAAAAAAGADKDSRQRHEAGSSGDQTTQQREGGSSGTANRDEL